MEGDRQPTPLATGVRWGADVCPRRQALGTRSGTRSHAAVPWAEPCCFQPAGGKPNDRQLGCQKELGMRYIIYGAGAVGGVIGGRLFAAGLDTVLICRGEHLEAIRANGMTLREAD